MRRSLALALLSVAALASACGGSVVFTEGSGGSGGSGGDEPPVVSGPAPDGPGPVGPVGPVGAGGNGPVSVTTGPGGGAPPSRCSLDALFGDPSCDDCALDACCAEAEACIADVERCATPEGQLDPGSELGGALLACLGASCSEVCGVAPGPDELCGSGLTIATDDPAADAAFLACFNASCCDAFAPCHADGDTEACIECLYGGGDASRCSDADTCALDACGVGIAFVEVCGSGHVVRNRDVGLCMDAQCCDQAIACTSGGADPGACDACVEAGGGALCDDLLACRSRLCPG